MSIEDRYAYGPPDEPELPDWLLAQAAESIRSRYGFGRGLWERIRWRFEDRIEREAEEMAYQLQGRQEP
jgi:hypothetical protein